MSLCYYQLFKIDIGFYFKIFAFPEERNTSLSFRVFNWIFYIWFAGRRQILIARYQRMRLISQHKAQYCSYTLEVSSLIPYLNWLTYANENYYKIRMYEVNLIPRKQIWVFADFLNLAYENCFKSHIYVPAISPHSKFLSWTAGTIERHVDLTVQKKNWSLIVLPDPGSIGGGGGARQRTRR